MVEEYWRDECELAELYRETGWAWQSFTERQVGHGGWENGPGSYFLMRRAAQMKQARDGPIGANGSFADGAGEEAAAQPVHATQQFLSGPRRVLLVLLAALHLRSG
jgi:hypothetical protein